MFLTFPLFSASSWAQNIDNKEQIVVTGGALPDQNDHATTVVIITPIISTIHAERVENTLRSIAGLQQFRRSDARSAHPTSQGMTMRGLGGNAASRMTVTMDGVPVTDPFGGWVNWPSIQSQRLGSIHVRRGGSVLSQGAGAIAGSIELFSHNSPADHAPFTTGLRYGSRNSISADMLAAGQLGNGSALAAIQYERSDGFIPIVKDWRGIADQRAPYEQGSLALRGVFDVGPSRELQASLGLFSDRRNRGTDHTDSQSQGGDVSLRLVNRGSLPWSAMLYGQLRQMRSGFASVNDDRSIANPVLDQYSVPATGWGGALLAQPSANLQIGADVRFVSGESRERYTFVNGAPTRLRKAGGDARTLGAHGSFGHDFGQAISVNISGRIDHWRLSGGQLYEQSNAGAVLTDLAYPVRRGWEPSASGTLTFNATEGLALRASAYTNWRLPTLNELYRPYRVGADAIAANPSLSPERVKGGEVALTYAHNGAKLSATFFANRLENAIANVTLAQGPGQFPGVGFVSAAGSYRQRRNLDAIDAKGVEVDATLPIAPRLNLSASYAFTDAEVEASAEAAALNGLRPAQVPRHSGSIRADWTHDKADAFVMARYVGRQFEDDQNNIGLSSIVTFDAGASLALTDELRVTLRAENLTDKLVEASRSSDGVIERAIPRTMWIGLSFGR